MNEIPKYIHYCWFGNGEMPKSHKKHIEGWKKIFPDHKIMLWNEENFPIDDFAYAKKAYEAKKFAFVSDVARIYALYKYGGIYLDTDVEVIRNPEELFDNKRVALGWESIELGTIGTGFIATVPNSEICDLMLEYYKNNDFYNAKDTAKIKSNTMIMAEILREKYSIYPSEKIQDMGWIVIYPETYFTAYDAQTMRPKVTKDTYAIHHFDASWLSVNRKFKRTVKTFLKRLKLIK